MENDFIRAFQLVSESIANDITSTVMAKVAERIRERSTIALEGTIVSNTWLPEDGTCSVLINDTAAADTDNGDAPIVIPGVRLHQPHVGDQTGPNGDERVHLIMTQSGWAAESYHLAETSLKVPAQERMITLKKRFTIKTNAGGMLDLNDNTKTYTLVSPGGLVVTLDDNAGEIYLGKNGLTTSDAVVTATDLQEAVDGVRQAVQTALNQLAAEVQSGSGVGPPSVGPVTASGSTSVESKE